MSTFTPPQLDRDVLRSAIRDEYEVVARNPRHGFHFHTGRPLAALVGYADEWLEGVPEASIESFAGTGNPFSLGVLQANERVVDVGAGAGIVRESYRLRRRASSLRGLAHGKTEEVFP